jgi:hypothetical protein
VTSWTGTDQHPDVAEISALAEGVLPLGRTADVRDHLAGCDLCADVRDSLDEIRGLLGALPGPPRMPADVAGRIDAALAAEALLDSTAPASVSRETNIVSEHGPGTDTDTADVSRETAAAAAARAPRSADRPDGQSRASTGPGRGSRVRRRWRTAVFGTACALAVSGLGGVVVQAINSAGSDSSARSAIAEKADAREDSALSASGLEAQVRRLLAASDTAESTTRTAPSAPENEVGAQSSPNRPMRGTETTLPACVRAGIGRADVPIADDQITYQGAAAYLVVLPHASDPTRVVVFVVDSSCTARTPQGTGDILLKDVYKRG